MSYVCVSFGSLIILQLDLTLVVRCFQVPSLSLLNLALSMPWRSTMVLRASLIFALSILRDMRTVMLWLNRLVPLCPLAACWKYKSWIGDRENWVPEAARGRPTCCFFLLSVSVALFASCSMDSVWMMSWSRTERPCFLAFETTAMPVILSPPGNIC